MSSSYAAENPRSLQRHAAKLVRERKSYIRRALMHSLVWTAGRGQKVKEVDLSSLPSRSFIIVSTTAECYGIDVWSTTSRETWVSGRLIEYVCGVGIHYRNGFNELIRGVLKPADVQRANGRVQRHLVVGQQLIMGDDEPVGVITKLVIR